MGGAEIPAVNYSWEAPSGRQAPLLKKFKLKAFEWKHVYETTSKARDYETQEMKDVSEAKM